MREQKVMLDRDLAELYGVKAIRLREQVKRNPERFPQNFMFQLTEQEVEDMVSQNAIPSRQVLGGTLPYAFTEHGILMLSNVLKSEKAIQMSIRIIEMFVETARSAVVA
ncbi:MAG: ORF6N domain-containing protein [Sphingobacteriaceae bacterium]